MCEHCGLQDEPQAFVHTDYTGPWGRPCGLTRPSPTGNASSDHPNGDLHATKGAPVDVDHTKWDTAEGELANEMSDGGDDIVDVSRCKRKRTLLDSFGCEQDEESIPDGGLVKRAAKRVHRVAPEARDIKRSSGAKSYENLDISGQARVHAGDVNTVNNNNFDFSGLVGSFLALMQQTRRPEDRDEATFTLLGQTTLVMVIEATRAMACLFILLQSIMSPPSPPKQINIRCTTFENAFGEIKMIDLECVVDWTSFHYLLTQNHRHRPGFRRVANAGYRLTERSRSSEIIDPNHPPPFVAIFRPGTYVQMSIHFDYLGEYDGKCPRCSLTQACDDGVEATCDRCGFMYRINVGSYIFTTAKSFARSINSPPGRRNTRSSTTWNDPDDISDSPADFTRISISEPPVTAQDESKRAADAAKQDPEKKRILYDYERKQREAKDKAKAVQQRLMEKLEREKREAKEEERLFLEKIEHQKREPREEEKRVIERVEEEKREAKEREEREWASKRLQSQIQRLQTARSRVSDRPSSAGDLFGPTVSVGRGASASPSLRNLLS